MQKKTLQDYLDTEIGNSPHDGVVKPQMYYKCMRIRRGFEEGGLEGAQTVLDTIRKVQYQSIKKSWMHDPERLEKARKRNNEAAKKRYWDRRAQDSSPPCKLGRPRTLDYGTGLLEN